MNVWQELKTELQKLSGKKVEKETLISDLDLDSLSLLDTLLTLEKSHNIRIDDEELLNLKTVNDILVAIESKIK